MKLKGMRICPQSTNNSQYEKMAPSPKKGISQNLQYQINPTTQFSNYNTRYCIFKYEHQQYIVIKALNVAVGLIKFNINQAGYILLISFL
jgi:hypothetical protein